VQPVPMRSRLEWALTRLTRPLKCSLDRLRLLRDRATLARRRRVHHTSPSPLISVRIATYNRPKLLLERAIPSVLRQTYDRFEVVIVGDCSPASAEIEAGVRRFSDPRLRFRNLGRRGPYPRDPYLFWMVAGVYAVNAALDDCRGSWVAPLDDDDEFTDDHLALLLKEAQSRDLEFVHAKAEMEVEPGRWQVIGRSPLECGQVTQPAILYSSVVSFLRYDRHAWILGVPADCLLWNRMVDLGVRIGFLDAVVARHFLESRTAV
jgi:glycosyltransferase involved in cell wall biosynthesis